MILPASGSLPVTLSTHNYKRRVVSTDVHTLLVQGEAEKKVHMHNDEEEEKEEDSVLTRLCVN